MSSGAWSARQWVLRSRPKGEPVPSDVELVEVDVPTPGPGQVLVRNHYLSVDPYMRGRMNAAKSYAAPYEIGEPLYGGAVGEVVASEDPRVPVGDVRAARARLAHALARARPGPPSSSTRRRRRCRATSACSACPG